MEPDRSSFLEACVIGTAILISSAFPVAVFAHGGMESSAGGVTVTLFMKPIAPLVREKVDMAFVFRKSGATQRFTDLPVSLTLVDTFYGDASKDRTILKEESSTDVNGMLEFEYTFEKENYFDVDIDFVDPSTGEKEEVGFLLRPRDPRTSVAVERTASPTLPWQVPSAAGVLVGATSMLLFGRRRGV